MRLRSRLVAPAVAAAALLVGMAPPASAADAKAEVSYGGVLKARGSWDDLTDNLCARVFNAPRASSANVSIFPADGSGPSFGVVDAGGDTQAACTGNLSIPEDEKYVMKVQWWSADNSVIKSESTTFYT